MPGENLVLAPFGVATNLGMVLEGARGQAAAELRAALGVNETHADLLRTGFRAVLARFQVRETSATRRETPACMSAHS